MLKALGAAEAEAILGGYEVDESGNRVYNESCVYSDFGGGLVLVVEGDIQYNGSEFVGGGSSESYIVPAWEVSPTCKQIP